MAFNDKVMAYVARPFNRGKLEGATHVGCDGTPGEGRYSKIYLVVHDGYVHRAFFESDNCPASVACGSLICQIIIGKPTVVAELISGDDLIVILGGLPEGKGELAHKAANALKRALNPES